MKSIYKSEQGKNKVLELDSKQLNKLNCTYKDIFVDTSYGKTHIVEIENLDKPPLHLYNVIIPSDNAIFSDRVVS